MKEKLYKPMVIELILKNTVNFVFNIDNICL